MFTRELMAECPWRHCRTFSQRFSLFLGRWLCCVSVLGRYMSHKSRAYNNSSPAGKADVRWKKTQHSCRVKNLEQTKGLNEVRTCCSFASGICLHCGSGCGFSLLLISPFVFECLIWMPLMCPASVTKSLSGLSSSSLSNLASWKVSIDCTCYLWT